MQLELAEFPVREICLGNVHRYRSGRLELDAEALARIVLEDRRIEAARFETVAPGEHARITGIRDIVEPRAKFGGVAQVFPGTIGPVESVGVGMTHRLSGMAVVATAAYEGTIRAGTGVQRSAILDMWGPGAAASRFSRLLHLVLIMRLKQGLGEYDAHSAIQRAEFLVAKKLAELTQGLRPERVGRYELASSSKPAPRVVLIQGCITNGGQPHSGVSYYGLPIRESLSTLIHPNELLDGAMTTNTTRGIGYYPTTWDWQNHPLALELYREQSAGRLGFAGVIIERIAYETIHGKEVVAHNTAQLAAQIGAEAALVTWLGSGNAFVDMMLTIRACERLGIKTTLVTYEYGGKDGADSPLLYYTPEADAVVSTGSRDRWIELPEADRLIGPYDEICVLSYPGAPVTPARGAFILDARDMLIGGVDIWGGDSGACMAF
ncbi:MAG TPA: glycine/sarcosine/betaine reductase component B subunit [Candidatus Limnocylindria bacterium]|nr:glycine/sarcosine/betaine reductase component B subunit [Candidatus Limnocylindria bacterium]